MVVSIVAVLDGVDPKTRQYTDPIAAIKKDIAGVQADKTMKPADRKKALESPERGIGGSAAGAAPRPTSQLVLKYYDKLSAIAQ